MNHYEKLILPAIEDAYEKLTNVEKNIAEFFLNNTEQIEMSSKSIAKRLFVSEASLSRFAKKCGFKGFREFLFYYENAFHNKSKDVNELMQMVFNMYQELLDKTLELSEEMKIRKIAGILGKSKKVYVYGIGSSGIAAKEFKLRFMRVGLFVEAVTDAHMMRMNSVLVDKDTLVLGITLSGKTEEILEALKISKKRGGTTVMLTAYPQESFFDYCDEVLQIAAFRNLEFGTLISPQFPVLIMIDIVYAYFMNLDLNQKSAFHSDTLEALYGKTTEK